MSRGDIASWALWALFVVGLTIASVFDEEPLTCPSNYSTEYTSSGHKFCLRVLPECKAGE